MTVTRYRQYLGLTQLEQRLSYWDLSMDAILLSNDCDRWRSEVDYALERGETPFYWEYPEISVDLNTYSFSRDMPEDVTYSSSPDSPYQQELQRRREEFLREFVEKFPDAHVFRVGGQSAIFWQSFDDVGIKVGVGQALCERVLVREEVVEVPDPDAMKNIPKVKEVRPVYEWRCNDAEFFDTKPTELGVRLVAKI